MKNIINSFFAGNGFGKCHLLDTNNIGVLIQNLIINLFKSIPSLSNPSTMELYAGIDIGGSHLAVGLINATNNYILETREMTHTHDVSPSDVIHSIVKFIDEMMDKISPDRLIPLLGIGVGCPGQAKDGILVKASNLPKFENAPLEKMLSQAMRGVPVILLNDADAAISAEVVGNPAIYSEYKNVAMVTLGTGIGVGLILEGQLYQGSNGLVEAGHMIVATHPNARKCGCGQVGCVEVYSSARNTALRLEELDALDNPKQLSTTSDSEKGEKVSLNGKDVFARYAANEYNAVTVVEEVSNTP
jgi:predicted NBD/HSP70 family sugar kinase